jgi:hypothetical protein
MRDIETRRWERPCYRLNKAWVMWRCLIMDPRQTIEVGSAQIPQSQHGDIVSLRHALREVLDRQV